MRISSGEHPFFSRGLEAAGEHTLVSRSGSRLKSDVLLARITEQKLQLHAFPRSSDPNACIVSCGRGTFRFPSFAVLGRLKSQDAGFEVDEVGAIEVSAAQEDFKSRASVRTPGSVQ